MTDPGSALEIASLSLEFVKGLYKYYQDWSRCDSDVKELRPRLLWLARVFTETEDALQRPAFSATYHDALTTALRTCRENASSMQIVLATIRKEHPNPRTAMERLAAAGRRAMTPFKKSTVQVLQGYRGMAGSIEPGY